MTASARAGPERPHPAATVALLAESVRRELYDLVRRAAGPVSRDEAAAHVGISRKLAAFHLDKLVSGGLLRSHTDQPARGVGRRPKVYEPSDLEVAFSLPPRRYELLAEVLLDAIESRQPGREAAQAAARQRGRGVGERARSGSRAGRLGPERALTLAARALDPLGFEPHRAGPRHLVLRNCPFGPLAGRWRDLVCGLNQEFCAGVVEGLDAPGVVADLVPDAGRCCVQLRGE